MGKPYSDLEKRAIAILAGGGNPATSQDQAVARYWQWKINPSAASHDLPAASTRTAKRKKDPRYILPFGIVLNAQLFALVQITKRTDEALTAQAGVKTACAYKTLGSGDQALKLRSFRPAYVYFRLGAAENSTSRTSRITNRSYKSYYTPQDEGFLAPFGRNTGAETEAVRQAAIKAAFTAPVPNLISFTPEVYRA